MNSLNVGYFGQSRDQTSTCWTSELFSKEGNESSIMKGKMAWNYELAPNASNPFENKVSKHCIIEPTLIELDHIDSTFFTQRYYFHFNQ